MSMTRVLRQTARLLTDNHDREVCTSLGNNLMPLETATDASDVALDVENCSERTWLGRLAMPIPSLIGAREAIGRVCGDGRLRGQRNQTQKSFENTSPVWSCLESRFSVIPAALNSAA